MTIHQITISGGFHNRPPITLRLRNDRMSVGQYRRLIRHMCPVHGCICGLRDWDTQGIDWPVFTDMLTTAMINRYDQRNGGYAK